MDEAMWSIALTAHNVVYAGQKVVVSVWHRVGDIFDVSVKTLDLLPIRDHVVTMVDGSPVFD